MTSPREGWSVDLALATVGTSERRLLDLLGSVVATDPAYLVGSLAAGFGNARSDVDIQVFVTSDVAPVPMIFFIDDTPIDVQYFRQGSPQMAAEQLDVCVGHIGLLRCARSPAPPAKQQKRISRWLTALPLEHCSAALITGDQSRLIEAHLVRGALEEAIRHLALASLLSRCRHLLEPVAARRAATAIVEAEVRSRGETFVGDKWIWRKARRANLLDRRKRVAQVSSWEEALSRAHALGIDDDAPHEAVFFEAVRPSSSIMLAGEEWHVRADRTIVNGPHGPERTSFDDWDGPDAALHLVTQIGRGLIRIAPDSDRINGWFN